MPDREQKLKERVEMRNGNSPLIDEAEILADVLNSLDRFATALERVADALETKKTTGKL
jgi:archaellum component FlaC